MQYQKQLMSKSRAKEFGNKNNLETPPPPGGGGIFEICFFRFDSIRAVTRSTVSKGIDYPRRPAQPSARQTAGILVCPCDELRKRCRVMVIDQIRVFFRIENENKNK